MKNFIPLCIVMLIGCAKPSSQDTEHTFADAIIYKNQLCASFDILTVPRCDRVTFAALVAAYCPQQRSIDEYYRDGMWHRDVEACYTDRDVGSKSECSLDGYMGVIHYALETNNEDILSQMHDDLSANGWYCGPGYTGATWAIQLKPFLSSEFRLADMFKNFRGHLLALYIWARTKDGSRPTTVELGLLQKLYAAHPESPFYAALNHRWSDYNYDDAIAKIFALDDSEKIWGSCPMAAYIAMTVAVMEDR